MLIYLDVKNKRWHIYNIYLLWA